MHARARHTPSGAPPAPEGALGARVARSRVCPASAVGVHVFEWARRTLAAARQRPRGANALSAPHAANAARASSAPRRKGTRAARARG